MSEVDVEWKLPLQKSHTCIYKPLILYLKNLTSGKCNIIVHNGSKWIKSI